VIRYKDEPITEEMIAHLLNGNEHRGNDASGVVLSQVDGKLNVLKINTPACQFIGTKEYENFIEKYLKKDTWGALVHTRYATKGSPKDNNNNHPLFAGKSAVIHNGTLSNDDSLFSSLNLTRVGEVDSDILRAIIDSTGINEKAIKTLNKVSGSCSGAAFDSRQPKKMLLFRSGSPMILGSTENFFSFSSERGAVYKSMKPYIKRFGVWFQLEKSHAALAPMADNTAWIMGPGGHEAHYEFKTMTGNYHEPIRMTYQGYEDRQKKWDSDVRNKVRTKGNVKVDTDLAACPNCFKEWRIPKGEVAGNFSCNKDEGGCGTLLVSIDRREAYKGKGVN